MNTNMPVSGSFLQEVVITTKPLKLVRGVRIDNYSIRMISREVTSAVNTWLYSQETNHNRE